MSLDRDLWVREARCCVWGLASVADHYWEMHRIWSTSSELGKDISVVLVVLMIVQETVVPSFSAWCCYCCYNYLGTIIATPFL
jgi:hypothetical protein